MNEIILSQTGSEVTADSRDVSEHFGKNHQHVLEAIRKLTEQTSVEFSTDLFIESTYLDSYNRSQKCYHMTRDGFALLVMGFTGKEALIWKLKYIDAFNKMEKTLIVQKGIPQTFAEALRLAAEQQEQIEQAKEALSKAQPAVLFARSVQTSHTSILIGDLAKIIKQNGVEIGAKRLFESLRNDGFLIKRQGQDYNSPSQKSMEMGLFEIKETVISHADGHTTISKTPKCTGRGQVYFVNRFLGAEK